MIEIYRKNQGQEANHSGKSLERDIANEFHSRGVLIMPYGERADNLDFFQSRRLITRVPQRNWFKRISYSEFVYRGPDGLNVRIECKWQECAGSVDEKVPSLVWNAECAPEKNVWIVIGGAGMRNAIRKTLYEICIKTCDEGIKNLRFLTPGDVKRAIKYLVEDNDAGSSLRDNPYQEPPRILRQKAKLSPLIHNEPGQQSINFKSTHKSSSAYR